MPYSEFNLAKVKKNFSLEEIYDNLFENFTPLQPSNWLEETLDISLELAIYSSSEKARSEFIVVPILLELERINNKKFAIYSGENLDVDESKGLNGECDFILTKGRITNTIQTPIFSLLEAKKNDIKSGLGQCIAQMLGAKIYNENEGNQIDSIYGCVTTGENWQFMKLENNRIIIDIKRYYINDLGLLLRVFQNILDTFE